MGSVAARRFLTLYAVLLVMVMTLWNHTMVLLLILTIAHAAYAVKLYKDSTIRCIDCNLHDECERFRAEFGREPPCKRKVDRTDMWLAVVGTLIWGSLLVAKMVWC